MDITIADQSAKLKMVLFFLNQNISCWNSKTCVKQPLKNRQNKDFNDK